MARVVLERLTKTFEGPRGEKVSALKNASLVVHDKEFLVLVGPSGSGKTTLLRIIAGLEETAQGTVSIDGRVVNHLPARDRDIAMVFQNYALYPHLTVYDNLALGLRLRKCPRAKILQRVTETAEFLGLIPCLDRLPNELSGGQRQRVALGRALIRKPKVFLFDEPLSNLDTHLRAQMRAEILKLRQRAPATMIYVTHDQFEAMTMGDRIVVLKEGVIQQIAAPLELYNAPANLFVASFIGSPAMNFFHGTITAAGNSLYFEAEPIPNQSRLNNLKACLLPITAPRLSPYLGKEVTLGIRPEDITHNQTEDEASCEVIAPASVGAVECLGPETHVYVRSGKESFVVRAQPSAPLQSGEIVSIYFNMRKAHFFDPITERSIL